MNLYFIAAAVLAFVVGLVHSSLGEWLIFGRMRVVGLVPTNGGSVLHERHVRILWANWHVATAFGWCLAVVLAWLAPPSSRLQVELISRRSMALRTASLVLAIVGITVALAITRSRTNRRPPTSATRSCRWRPKWHKATVPSLQSLSSSTNRSRALQVHKVINPLLAATVVALASIAPSAAVAQTTIRVAATYWERPCGMPGQLAKSAPVTAGKLEVRRGAGAPVTVMLGAAPASVALTGSGFPTARLILETPRVKVVSGVASSTAIAINLGIAVSVGGVETFSMGRKEDNDNGNINALITLERAADIAEQANGAPLPQLTARVFEGPTGVPSATQFDTPAAINVVAVAGSDDRWESTPLIHEYGHFVLEQVAPGGPSGGAHSIATSYPQMPDLAWTEGFPSAFAAVVTKPEWSGNLFYKCGPYQLLARVPPLATRQDERYAQYNESRVAAVAYQLTEYLGGGAPGLKRLLDAMKIYKRDRHAAWTARDLRDLAVQEFEKSAADHAAIDDIFETQGMSWEQSFGLEIDGSEDYGKWADIEIMLSVTGPGGFDCRATSDIYETKLSALDGGRGVVTGTMVARGGLAYSANDDCYLISGDGVVGKPRPKARTMGIDGVVIPFPYLGGLAHWAGPYTVRAKYVCARDPNAGSAPGGVRCPATFTVQLRVWNQRLIFNEPNLLKPIPVTLVKDNDMPIVTFKANGECKAIVAVDCGF